MRPIRPIQIRQSQTIPMRISQFQFGLPQISPQQLYNEFIENAAGVEEDKDGMKNLFGNYEILPYYKFDNPGNGYLRKQFRVAIIHRIETFLYTIIKNTSPVSRNWKIDVRFPKRNKLKIRIFMNAGIFKMELTREKIIELYLKATIEKEIIEKIKNYFKKN